MPAKKYAIMRSSDIFEAHDDPTAASSSGGGAHQSGKGDATAATSSSPRPSTPVADPPPHIPPPQVSVQQTTFRFRTDSDAAKRMPTRKSTIGGSSIRGDDLFEDALMETNDARRRRVAHSLLPANIAKAESSKEAVRAVFTGSFLPLMNDKFRNNVRNRPLLAAVYGVGAAFVAMLLVVLFAFPSANQWTMSFAVPPPSTVYVGTPIDTFVVQIIDADRRGVAGISLAAIFFPLEDYNVYASLNQGQILSHTIRCPLTLAEPNTGRLTNRLFCKPSDFNATFNWTAVTDEHGMARFENVVLGFGAPTMYFLGVLTDDGGGDGSSSQLQLLTTVINVRTHVVSTTVTLPPADFVNASVVLDPDVDGPPQYTFNFTLDVQWRSPKPPSVFCAGMVSFDLQGASLKSPSVPIPLIDTVEKFVDFSEYMFCTSDIRLVSNGGEGSNESSKSSADDASSVFGSSSSSSSFDVASLEEELVSLKNLWFSSTASDVLPSSCSDCPEYAATIVSPAIYLVASNTQQPFPGVSALGVNTPIAARHIDTPFQAPQQIVLPFAIQTSVERVIARGVPSEIVEGTSLSDFQAHAYNAAGEEINRVGFLYLGCAPNLNPSLTGVRIKNMIGVNMKKILHDSFETCDSCDGWASSSDSVDDRRRRRPQRLRSAQSTNSSTTSQQPSFSVSGAVGFYRVYVAVDGVLAQWPDNENRPYMTVHITSSVNISASTLLWVGGLGADSASISLDKTEVIGNVWRYIPLLSIVDLYGRLLIGKTFDIVASNTSASATVYESFALTSSGYASAFDIQTIFRDGGSGLIEFDVVVDGAVVTTFVRNFTMPTSAQMRVQSAEAAHVVKGLIGGGGPAGSAGGGGGGGQQQNQQESNAFASLTDADLEAQCVFVRLLHVPTVMYTDLAQVMLVQTVTRNGTAVPFSPVVLAPSITAQFGENQTYYFVTDAHGILEVDVGGIGLTGITSAFAAAVCPNSLSESWVGGVFQPRVTNVGVSINGRSCHISVDANWSLVSAEMPITITTALTYYPSYVTLWFQSSGIPQVGTVNVTGPENSNVTLVLSSQANAPGIYGVLPVVGRAYVNPFNLVPFNLDVDTLVLVQSVFSKANDTIFLNQVLPQAAIIEIRRSNGELAEGYQLFAQSIFTFPNGSRVFADFGSDSTIAQYGMFLNIGSADNRAVSTISGPDGIVSFANLSCIGAMPGINMSFRYCIAVDMAFDVKNLTSTASICVEDSRYGFYNPNQTISFQIDQASLSGTPGQALGEISVTAKVADGTSPLNIMACSVFLDNFDQSLLNANVPNIFLPFATYFAVNTNRLVIPAGTLSLVSTAVSEVHSLVLVCTGGSSNRVNLLITSQPYSVNFVLVPQPPVPVRSVFGVTVQVLSASGLPLANVPVQLTMKPQNRLKCFENQCGVMWPTSVTIVSTDDEGLASFVGGFAEANSGNYTLTVTVVSQFNRAVVQSIATASIGALTRDSGRELPYLIEQCGNQSGCVAPMLMVLANLASSNTDKSLFAGPIKGLVALLTSVDGNGKAVSASLTLPFLNPVSFVEILQQSELTLEIPRSRSIESNFVGSAPVVFPIGASQSYVVRFLDKTGAPVAGAELALVAVGSGDDMSDVSVSLANSDTISDANGLVSMGPFTITASKPTTFRFFISASGGGGNMSLPIEIISTTDLSTTDTMKIMSAALVLFFSPMLASSVPHSKALYLVLGVVSATVSGIGTILLHDYVPDNPFVEGYYYFLVTAIFGLAAFSMLLLIAHWIGEVLQRPGWKVVNDENKAARIFLYSSWLTNVRVRRLDDEGRRLAGGCWGSEEELVPMAQETDQLIHDDASNGVVVATLEKKAVSTAPKHRELTYDELLGALLPVEEAKKRKAEALKQQRKQNFRARIAGQVNALLDEDVIRFDDGDHRRTRRDYNARPTLSYPAFIRDIEPVYMPFNFVIVAAITVVLLVIEVFLLLYLYHFIDTKSQELISYLPSTSDSPQLIAANHFLIMLLSDGITFCVTQFPSLYTMTRILPAIHSLNLVNALASAHDVINQAVNGIVLLFSVAGTVATIAVAVSLLLTARTICATIRRIRRGELTVSHSIGPIEGYIGLHSLHMILVHQLVFWLVVITGALLAVEVIRLALYRTLMVFTAASLVSYAVQFGLQRVLVGWFLVSGQSLVIRPELYALWHFVGLILGVFTGLLKSISRWVFAVVSMTVLFSRLDQSIFPASLQWIDMAHSGFMSVVALEAKNGNPLVLMFVAHLLVEKELQYLSDEYYLHDKEEEDARHILLNVQTSDNSTLPTAAANTTTGITDASTCAAATSNKPRRRATTTTAVRRKPNSSASGGGHTTSSTTWHISCFHLFDQDHCLSAAVKNLARLYVAHRYGDRSCAAPAPPAATTCGCHANPLDATLVPLPGGKTVVGEGAPTTKPGGHAYADRPMADRLHYADRLETNVSSFVPFQHQWVDLKPFFNGTRSRRTRRMQLQQRWWLWVMLTLNPSLRQERKHALYEDEEKPCCAEKEEEGHDDGEDRVHEAAVAI